MNMDLNNFRIDIGNFRKFFYIIWKSHKIPGRASLGLTCNELFLIFWPLNLYLFFVSGKNYATTVGWSASPGRPKSKKPDSE